MVFGRIGFSAVLMAIGTIVFCWVLLLSAIPSGAQTVGATISNQGQYGAQERTGQSDEGCSNPQAVETFTGTENQSTPQFRITGNTFRISYDVEVTNSNGFPVLEVDVLDDSGQFIGEGFISFGEDGSENILAGPGTFSLEIRADDVEYTVTVEDCAGTDRTTGGPTTGQSGGGTIGRGEEKIINIPGKPLPPTGGGSAIYVMVAGSILAGAGLLAWRLSGQRGRRG